ADDSIAQRVLDAVEINFDDVARLRLAGAVVDKKFTERNAAFGLEANVDHHEVLLDSDDGGGNNAAFDHAAGREAFVQERREIVAGGVEGGLGLRRHTCTCSNINKGQPVGSGGLGATMAPSSGRFGRG